MTSAMGAILVCGILIGADASEDQLLETLKAQEIAVIEAIKKNDQKAVRKLLADEVYSIRPGRGRLTREELLKDLDGVILTSYKLTEVKAISVTQDVGILSYVYTSTGKLKGQDFAGHPVYATSTWVRRGGEWKSVFYQETPK